MKILPNGCTCTEVWASPDDWKTTTAKSSMKKNWYVQCNFHDPNFEEEYPKGFPFRKKLNKFKTLEDRKAAVELYLLEIPKLFLEKGYNPITKKYHIKEPVPALVEEKDAALKEMLPETLFLTALQLAKDSKKLAVSTHEDIKYMLVRIGKAAESLQLADLKIYYVQRKHIRNILDHLEETEPTFSAHKFNKYIGYLSILFGELMEYEAVLINPTIGIRKRIHEKKIRETLNEAERTTVNEHLKNNYPDFWRFTLIFFHSGGRIRELLDLRTEDISLATQSYRTLVKKGGRQVWVNRVIKDIAIPIWIKALYKAEKGDYVFSRGLVAGPQRIRREQIDKRWRVHVKQKLNITADFYALKHLNLDETAEILSLKDAAKMASHTSTRMVEKHYAVGEEKRQIERLKTIDNHFSKTV